MCILSRSIDRMSDDFFQTEGALLITPEMLEQMNDHGSALKSELQRRFAIQKAAMGQSGDQQNVRARLAADAERVELKQQQREPAIALAAQSNG
jgi:hypothetical protein